MIIDRGGWWARSDAALAFAGCFWIGFGGPDAGPRGECGSGAVWLVSAEHLCGESWVVSKPAVRECFVELRVKEMLHGVAKTRLSDLIGHIYLKKRQ